MVCLSIDLKFNYDIRVHNTRMGMYFRSDFYSTNIIQQYQASRSINCTDIALEFMKMS